MLVDDQRAVVARRRAADLAVSVLSSYERVLRDALARRDKIQAQLGAAGALPPQSG
jgi:hypothetical protein